MQYLFYYIAHLASCYLFVVKKELILFTWFK